MCGIAGLILSPTATLTDPRRRLACMLDAQTHRGPDDAGLYWSPDRRVGLANRRLAIRDLSAAGHMPMLNDTAALAITYNGELYNDADLRAELVSAGRVFRSASDTEVILHGYSQWGEAVAARLRGMFAFAILTMHSGQCRSIFMARDPLGIKPLYYARTQGCFLFASECKALHAAGLTSAEPNPTALVTYLEFGSVPAPMTIYRDIAALDAGCTLTLPLDDAAPAMPAAPRRYWSLPPSAAIRPMPYADAVCQTHDLLLDSVRRHMVSDVPLGAFLSGGLDSSAIVALMREASPGAAIRTCSVVFAEKAFDEAWYAWQVSRAFETDHVEILVNPSDLGANLDAIVAALDQPTHDGINTWFVSRTARQTGLTVALSGLGGDELFGGYPTFRRLGAARRALSLSAALPAGRALFDAALNARGPYGPYARLAHRVNGHPPAWSDAYLGLRGLFGPAAIAGLLNPDVLAAAHRSFDLGAELDHAAAGPPSGAWDAASRLELTAYMRHQLLRDSDVMSMSHSLELRVPFVDSVVVDSVLRMPVSARSARAPNGAPKQLLRDAVPALPPVVRDRRTKQGFSFPFDAWLSGPLHAQFAALVDTAQQRFAQYFQPNACQTVLAAFDHRRTNWARPWALAALNAIMR